MPKQEYKNPYEGCVADKDCKRLNSDVRTADFNFIRSLRPSMGTMQTTINIIWKKLADECRKRGITSCAREAEFENLVLNFTFTLPEDGQDSNGRGTTGGTSGPIAEKPQGHDGGGTAILRPGSTTSSLVDTNVAKPSRRRGKGNKTNIEPK